MAIPVSQLNKSGTKKDIFNVIIKEQLQIIDDKLLQFPKSWGRNVMIHEIPMISSIGGLEKKDVQRILYSTLIQSLSKRGFDVKISLKDNSSMLYIAWTTTLSNEEVEQMNKIIKHAVIKDEEIPSFVKKNI